MNEAVKLLNKILAASQPGTTIVLTADHAHLLGKLGPRDIGALSEVIHELGAFSALEAHGLFGRDIVIASGTRSTPASYNEGVQLCKL